MLDDGGPAFPVSLLPGERFVGLGPANGMSLRDWFAGRHTPSEAEVLAMGKMLLSKLPPGRNEHMLEVKRAARAKLRYMEADAMLKARQKGTEDSQ